MDGKEIRLGDKKQAVISVLGEPEHIHENYGGGSWRHYYFDSELALDFDRNDRLEFIEFLDGHYGKLKPYIYGKTLIQKWVGTLVVHPLFYALIAWIMSLILK